VVIEHVTAAGLNGEPVRTGAPLRVTLDYRSAGPIEVHWGFSIWTGDQWVCVSGDVDFRPRMLAPGRGRLTATVPRLPVVAGRYSLRAVVAEAATMQPLALRGYRDPAVSFTVEGRPDFASNVQIAAKQLVTLDVDWD
jgi:hypothetical protein